MCRLWHIMKIIWSIIKYEINPASTTNSNRDNAGLQEVKVKMLAVTSLGDVWLEREIRSPLEVAGVGDAVGQRLDGDDVAAGTAQEDQSNRAWGRRLPGDGVWLSSRDLFVQTGQSNGIAAGRLVVVGGGVGGSQGHEGSGEDGDEAHFFFILYRKSD